MHHQRWRLIEQIRQILPEVVLLDIPARQVGVSCRRIEGRAGGAYHNFIADDAGHVQRKVNGLIPVEYQFLFFGLVADVSDFKMVSAIVDMADGIVTVCIGRGGEIFDADGGAS